MIGIYKITSPTNKIYIGQSVNIEKRWKYHKLSKDKKCSKLYSSFKKYGVDKHKFEVIHICIENELNELEKYYVDLYNCFNSKYGLNLKDGGGSKGNVSEETKLKISKATKGRVGKKKTYEQKLEQSIRQKGRVFSKETKLKMSLVKKGKLKSFETKLKMSNYSKNRSESHINNLSNSLKGKHKSKEHIENMKISKKGQIAWNKGISKYKFDLNEILYKLKYISCLKISKEYGCNEAVLRRFIKNNTCHTISYWRQIKEKKLKNICPF